MEYKPKLVAGKVTGTGWPIDGHVLYFTLWDYDRDNWHLYGWEDEADEAVMLTVFQTETEAGFCTCETLEAFTEIWKAKQWEPVGVFALPLDQVEVQEVKQEEVRSDARETLLSHGIDLTPRRQGEKGGILCLPMEKNLNGDVKAKHPDWELIECPNCGRECWKMPAAAKMEKEQGVQLLCTECALEAGLVAPYRPDASTALSLVSPPTPTLSGNYKQRRKAKLEQRRREKHERKKKQKRG